LTFSSLVLCSGFHCHMSFSAWRFSSCAWLNDSRGLPVAVVVISAVIGVCTRKTSGSPRPRRFEPRVRVSCVALVASFPDHAEAVVGAVSWRRQIVDPLSISRLRCLSNVDRHVVDCNEPQHLVIMAALWNTEGHYVFVLWFLRSIFFFPRLVSIVAEWMSAIVPHMV